MAVEDETQGVLKPVQGQEGQAGYIRITGVDIDKEGTAWAVGSNSKTAAYRKVKEGKWESLTLDYKDFGFDINTGKILASSSGQKWLAINNRGIIIVFEDDNGEVIREKSIEVKNQYEDAANFILSLAEDKDGLIWAGTNKGPFYYEPSEIFEVEKPLGRQPVVPRNDGTTFASLLLSSEQINDIAIDGANRKWFATEKSGVYLVSPDGLKEIYHFTAENSPLLSNSVQTIGINDKTGEVFFGTEKGLIAYRAGATEGGDDFGDVYVFPNPVRETFEGNITVTGLAANVNVKITDIAGNLVFETTALGGSAVWNGRNFRGDRVQTGVYLVFCTNDDGSKTFVTKLLFIH
jgi:ligand-binding sensor domain-containing protein